VYDETSPEWHIVTLQLLGQSLGFGIEIEQASGQIADTGVSAVVDHLL
jgi:hypothetical protein